MRTNSRAVIQIGWEDVPWLDEKTKEEMLAGTPPFQREAVKYGIPSLGSGAVYPVPLDDVVLTPSAASRLMPMPPHWRFIYGMDVGWNKTAVVFLAHDPDNDIVYVYDEYCKGQREPELHAMHIKARGDWQIGVIDPAARQRNQIDGQKLIRIYRSPPLSLKLREANNQVEAGVTSIWQRLSAGKLKFFPNTPNLQSEYLVYRRDEHGKIVKEHDHALDALRYAINSLNLAQPKRDVGPAISHKVRKYNV